MQYTDEPVDSTSQVLVSIMISVSLSNKGISFEVDTPRHQQSILSRNNGEAHLHPTSRRRSSEILRRQSWQMGREHVWNSL